MPRTSGTDPSKAGFGPSDALAALLKGMGAQLPPVYDHGRASRPLGRTWDEGAAPLEEAVSRGTRFARMVGKSALFGVDEQRARRAAAEVASMLQAVAKAAGWLEEDTT